MTCAGHSDILVAKQNLLCEYSEVSVDIHIQARLTFLSYAIRKSSSNGTLVMFSSNVF